MVNLRETRNTVVYGVVFGKPSSEENFPDYTAPQAYQTQDQKPVNADQFSDDVQLPSDVEPA